VNEGMAGGVPHGPHSGLAAMPFEQVPVRQVSPAAVSAGASEIQDALDVWDRHSSASLVCTWAASSVCDV